MADRFDDRPALWRAFDVTAHRAAERDHPDRPGLRAAAEAAVRAGEQAQAALTEARRQQRERLAPLGPAAWAPDPAGSLAHFEGYVSPPGTSWPTHGRASPTCGPSWLASVSRPTGSPQPATPGAPGTPPSSSSARP